MSTDTVLSQLKEFDVLCCVDLAEISASPGRIYQILKTYYRQEYQPTQRLVFYTQHLPDLLLLDHLQQAAITTDVSNDFILICCPYDIGGDLTQLQTTNNCNTAIGNYVVDVESNVLENNFHIPKTICPLPWSHIAIGNQGEITPCCVNSEILGNVEDSDLLKIFQGPTLENLRNELLAGNKPKSCNYCWAPESHGVNSNRTRHLNFLKKEFLSEWLQMPSIRSLDLKPGNVCNFKCRICSPENSSLFANELLSTTPDQSQKIKIKSLIKQGQWFDNHDNAFNQIRQVLPFLENFDLYGGEPFLLKQLPILLNEAVDQGYAKNIRLHFNSNGSIFPNQMIDLFLKFKSVDIALSIDNIEQKFELERGSSWDIVETNIKRFISLQSDRFHCYIFCTVNIQNVLYLDELINWAAEIGIDVIFNFLQSPALFNIDYMTPTAKKLVIEKYQSSKHPTLQAIVNQISKSPGSDGTKFCNKIRYYDQTRSQNFHLTHKEIADAMCTML